MHDVVSGCFCQQVCLLASQQGNYSSLFYRSNLPLELVNNGNGFVKFKFFQTNPNLTDEGEEIKAISLDMSNDFVATSEEILLGKLKYTFSMNSEILYYFCLLFSCLLIQVNIQCTVHSKVIIKLLIMSILRKRKKFFNNVWIEF